MAHVLKKPVDGEYDILVLSKSQMEDEMTVRSDVLQATYFADKAAAGYVAASNQAHEEDGWTYVVVTRGIYSFVQVRDEDGVILGYL